MQFLHRTHLGKGRLLPSSKLFLSINAAKFSSLSNARRLEELSRFVDVKRRRSSGLLGCRANGLENIYLNPVQSSRKQAVLPGESLLSDLSYFDVLVVGGGASGIAVITQLIEKIQQGKQIRSIALVEKSEAVGPGLAYSENCEATILNMHADTMGLYADNPTHFSDWMKVHLSGCRDEEDHFPPRYIYGQYLASLVRNAAQNAERLGVVFCVVHCEVVNVQRVGEFHEIQLCNGTEICARDVILAIGNSPAMAHPELSGTPGYFSSPWPTDRLKAITPDSSVCIFGSRLSAIDAALVLTENGHRGLITFVSRNGQLPQVQDATSSFSRRFALHTLAKDIETSPDGALIKVVRAIQKEIERINVFDKARVRDSDDPLTELRHNISSAGNDAVSWQAVLRATSPMVERYWNCFCPEEKETFLKNYLSSWLTYRHPMPLKNAQKILALLEQGQLRIVKGHKGLRSSSEFVFPVEGGEIRSQFLIEAMGQELDPYRASSRLIRRLLSSRILLPHHAGGVSVDFSTLAADRGLYVIGAMTTGTHFYTSAIDRIAAHSARIADSIIGRPMRRSLHIVFFVGSDIFSHLMLSKLIPRLISHGHMPFVCLPMDRVNKAVNAFDLRELCFFERQLLQEHVIPFLGSSARKGAVSMTVDQMKSHYGIFVEKISDVNKPSFLEFLRSHHIDAGISLRCYQRFGKRILQYFRFPHCLLNLHPGILPSYRGVMTAIRAMANGEREFGYTLHHVNEHYDSGDILDIRTHPIDYPKSMLHVMGDVYDIGVEMVLDAIESLAHGTPLPASPQSAAGSQYYTFPTEEELEAYRMKGIHLVDPPAICDLLIQSFAPPGDEKALQQVIEKPARQWYEKAGVPSPI